MNFVNAFQKIALSLGVLFFGIGVFIYSHEEGTPSAKAYKDTISEEEKERRRAKIYEAQQMQLKENLLSWVGKEVEVLVEGFHEETDLLLKARHYGQAPGIDNITMINEGSAKKGDYVKVRINEIAGTDLVASILE